MCCLANTRDIAEIFSLYVGDFSRQERSYSKTRLFANLANIVIMRDQWEEKHGGFNPRRNIWL